MSLESLSKAPHGSWDEALAARIDHTALRIDTQPKDIERLCEEAKIWRFAAVCIHPCYVALAKQLLSDSAPRVCTVIGFPLGANTSKTKLFEAELAFNEGAVELDLVLNIGALKAGMLLYLQQELSHIRKAVPHAVLKLILETSALSQDEIIIACQLAAEAGFDFVKTSTGFGSHGATVEHVALMKRSIPESMQVKASGGIKERSKALELIAAGASRIGSSQSLQLVRLESPELI